MQIPTIPLSAVNMTDAGVFQCTMVPGNTLPHVSATDLVIQNPSEVFVRVMPNQPGVAHLLRVVVSDTVTKLTRDYSFHWMDILGRWKLVAAPILSLSAPCIPNEKLIAALKAATLPVAVIDIESKALSVNSVITSLGIAVGDMATGEVFTWAQFTVPVQGQEQRVADLETLKWWESERLKNPIVAEAETLMTDSCAPHVTGTLMQISKFFESFGDALNLVHVFANGPEFDSANLMSLYEYYGAKVPWRHGNNQSIRTAVLFGRKLINFDSKYADRPGMIPHFALHDALMEFHYASEAYRAIALHIANPKTVVEVTLESDPS